MTENDGGHEDLRLVDFAQLSMVVVPEHRVADISARVAELGRQPYSARRLFERHPDRILFGLDGFPPAPEMYRPYFRFLETADEHFPYSSRAIGGQGRWNIYGIDLPDDVLRSVYHGNAYRLLHMRSTDQERR